MGSEFQFYQTPLICLVNVPNIAFNFLKFTFIKYKLKLYYRLSFTKEIKPTEWENSSLHELRWTKKVCVELGRVSGAGAPIVHINNVVRPHKVELYLPTEMVKKKRILPQKVIPLW